MQDEPCTKALSKKLKVVILEDTFYALEGMRMRLESQDDMQLVGASAIPEEAVALIEAHQPDVAVLDLRIAGRFDLGFGVLESVTDRFPDVKCIVLTSFPELRYLVAAVDAGARAFVSKDDDPDLRPSLPVLIRKVAMGKTYYDPAMVNEMLMHLRRESFQSLEYDTQQACQDLTAREREVLALIAAECSNQEIADNLSISINTVKAHVSNLLDKLGVRSRDEARLIALANNSFTWDVSAEQYN